MKIISIIGTRPQFPKVYPIHIQLLDKADHIIIDTGQHYDYSMSGIHIKTFGLKPKYNLNISSTTHGEQIGRMIIELEKILLKEKPDIVIVYGDTNSTLSGSIISSRLGIKTAHIEAGLRSFDTSMPEESNRIIADNISDILFAPTENAYENLVKCGLSSKAIISGDVMVDTMISHSNIIDENQVLNTLGLVEKKYILMTLHRPSNVDVKEVLSNILLSLRNIDSRIVFPIHPRTKKSIESFGLDINDNIDIVNPQGYIDMIKLIKHAKYVITDSGGVQKESYILRTPCLTLRNTTEWVETLEHRWNILVYNPSYINSIILSNIPGKHNPNMYGDGHSAQRIVEHIMGL